MKQIIIAISIVIHAHNLNAGNLPLLSLASAAAPLNSQNILSQNAQEKSTMRPFAIEASKVLGIVAPKAQPSILSWNGKIKFRIGKNMNMILTYN